MANTQEKNLRGFLLYLAQLVACFVAARREEENNVVEAVHRFINNQQSHPVVCLRIFAALPKRYLPAFFTAPRAVAHIALSEFDRRSLDEGGFAEWPAYSVAVANECATSRTIRPYLRRINWRGFNHTEHARESALALSADARYANHVFSGLHDCDRDVVAGALNCISAVLSFLLDGRYAKTGQGKRFLAWQPKQDHLNDLWYQRCLCWSEYIEPVRAEDQVFFDQFPDQRLYERVLCGTSHRRDCERIDVEAMYAIWRDLVLEHAEQILGIADLFCTEYSLNPYVMVLFERLSMDDSPLVAQKLTSLWPQFRRHIFMRNLYGARSGSAYFAGIGGLRSYLL